MSVQAISWALSVATGDPSAKVVLLTLANYADERGRCWPAQATLAQQTDQSVDSIQRKLKDLETLGFIVRAERPYQNGKKGGLYFYHLLMPGIDREAALETMPQFAARSETKPQTDPNHAANSSKTIPQLCGTNHHSITTNSKESVGVDFKEDKSDLFKAFPNSPEFLAWKAHAIEKNQKAFVRFLTQREMEGRSFEFDSQWPPGHEPAPRREPPIRLRPNQ